MELAPYCTAEDVARWLESEDTAKLCVFLSIPVENSPLCRSKIPHP